MNGLTPRAKSVPCDGEPSRRLVETLGVEAASTDAASRPTAASPSEAPSVETIGTRFGAITVAAWSPSSPAASLARRRTRTSTLSSRR